MTASAEPLWRPDTVDQWILSATSAMNTRVATPVTTVIQVCMRMIRSKPITPPRMVSATTMISATTLVPSPPPQPSCLNTVAVASVARMTRTVSQPTVSNQEIAAGGLLPVTPNAAPLSTIGGGGPRLPPPQMNPQARKDRTNPPPPPMTGR